MDLIHLSWNPEVSIFDESGSGSGVNLPCVGTIISSYFILTVASCLVGKTQNKLTIKTKIQSGSEQNSTSKWEEEEQQIRNIERVIFHPDYKNFSTENDIAILVLDEHLNSAAKIMPILSVSNSISDESTLTSNNITKI